MSDPEAGGASPQRVGGSTPRITEITRRAIIDWMIVEPLPWRGGLDEVAFLSRLFDLAQLPSHDSRFKDAAGDIWQHRFNNRDWEDDWVFGDPRFGLVNGPDETFLRFLAETVHPVVRRDEAEVRRGVDAYNKHLRRDGWELRQGGDISGYPVFEAHSVSSGTRHALDAVKQAAEVLSSEYVDRQIRRMHASVEGDPELAIGTAKELVETVCKAVIEARATPLEGSPDVGPVAREALKSLGLARDDIPDAAKGADTIRRLLSNFAQVVQGLAELRNHYGTGHGRGADTRGLQPRHARLAVGAASTFATFVLETHVARPVQPQDGGKA